METEVFRIKSVYQLSCNILFTLNISVKSWVNNAPHFLPEPTQDDYVLQPLDARYEKSDLKVFVVVIPKEGWTRPRAPILLLV